MRIFTPVPGVDGETDEGMVIALDTLEEVSLFEQLIRQHQLALRDRIVTQQSIWDAGMGPKGEMERTYFQLGMVKAWLTELTKEGERDEHEDAQ